MGPEILSSTGAGVLPPPPHKLLSVLCTVQVHYVHEWLLSVVTSTVRPPQPSGPAKLNHFSAYPSSVVVSELCLSRLVLSLVVDIPPQRARLVAEQGTKPERRNGSRFLDPAWTPILSFAWALFWCFTAKVRLSSWSLRHFASGSLRGMAWAVWLRGWPALQAQSRWCGRSTWRRSFIRSCRSVSRLVLGLCPFAAFAHGLPVEVTEVYSCEDAPSDLDT